MIQVFWTIAEDEALSRLWGEGLTGAEIAARLNKTKNAVVGRAHRLHLQGRPSPIKNPRPRAVGAARKPRTVALAPREKLPTTRPVVALSTAPISKTRKCQWIGCAISHDDPQCTEFAIEGRSWCPEHYARVFVRTIKQRHHAEASMGAAAKYAGLVGENKTFIAAD